MHSNIVAPCLEFIGAVGERPLVSVQVCRPLLDLFPQLCQALSWMGTAMLRKHGSTKHGGNKSGFHFDRKREKQETGQTLERS